MLIKTETLERIEAGTVTLAFRRWRRPTVKAGGTLLTSVGQLSIEAVDRVEVDAITPTEAEQAGFDSLDELRSLLDRRSGDVYRVELSFLGPDPRIALRESAPSDEEMEEIVERLRRSDAATGALWTTATLELIDAHPGVLAADLAQQMGMDRAPFKSRVRRLKALGLTESLRVGYRLSPRGRAVLERLPDD